MTEDRIEGFIRSLDSANSDFLNALEEKALKEEIPVIRPAVQNLLKLLLSMKRPERILEVGAAVGFSAIFMTEYSDADIVTIEKYEPRIALLRDNIEASGRKDRIKVLEGDAGDILKTLVGKKEHFDFVFMDAAKAQYINYLPAVLKLLENGGLLVSDNVLQDGDVIESRFIIKRRNRTIHARMREYLYALTHSDELVTSILPIADGITVSVKNVK
ncbi:MAG: O-methyltransferase [Lachnospiraceae bacterium]|nr:O-methyltransferase [Lachnospiraceae bacterium]